MTILITGATGFIGKYLVQRLLDVSNQQIRVLTRDPSKIPTTWHDRIHVAVGDLLDKRTLAPIVQDVSVVFHLAGEINIVDQFDLVNFQGTKNLLDSLTGISLKHFLHYSSVGVIGAANSGTYSESSSCSPSNIYERSKLQGEQIALEYYNKERIPVTIVRPSIVFGTRQRDYRDSFLSWMKSIKDGKFRFIGPKTAIANYVYVEDVIESCIFLAQVDFSIGEIYHISDPCTIGEFVAEASKLMQVPLPNNIPSWLAMMAAYSFELTGKLFHFNPILTVGRVKALNSHSVFTSEKLQQKFVLPIGWREGLLRTISAYEYQGLL